MASERILVVVEDGPLPLPVCVVPPGWAWRLRRVQDVLGAAELDPDAVRPALLLLLGPRPSTVAALRSRFPTAGLLALVEHDAPMAPVVEVLEAGADTCVRSADPLLLGAHLTALAARAPRLRE